jgi:hypothetical protein
MVRRMQTEGNCTLGSCEENGNATSLKDWLDNNRYMLESEQGRRDCEKKLRGRKQETGEAERAEIAGKFAKTSPKRSFSLTDNERFAKTRSLNSVTVIFLSN